MLTHTNAYESPSVRVAFIQASGLLCASDQFKSLTVRSGNGINTYDDDSD